MKKTYTLYEGLYYIGDPANIINNNKAGHEFITKLWDFFYQNADQFQHLILDGIELFITRTLGGDGRFGDVGTDTGTICIVDTQQLVKDFRFEVDFEQVGVHFLEVKTTEKVTCEKFSLYFESGYEIITT
jgi:hypothetical protein